MPTVGEIVAVLRADSSQFTASMEKASAETEALKGSTTSFSKTASTAFIAAGAVAVVAIGKMVDTTVEWAREVKTLQNTTGQSAESASALISVAQEYGVGVTQLSTAFGIFQKNIVSGNKNIEKFGLVTRDASGNILPFDQLLSNAADTYTKLGTQAEKTAFAQLVFGRSGRALIPILKQGAEGLALLEEEARKTGNVIGQDVVDAAINLGIQQRKLGESVHGLTVQIGAQFLPVVTKLFQGLTDFFQLLVKINPAIPALGLGFLVVVGALTALVRVGQYVVGTFTKMFASLAGGTSEQAAATGATQGLAESITELTAALQAQAGAATEADAALAGYGATAAGLIPEEQALAAATAEVDGALAGGEGGVVASLGLINPVSLTAAAGLAVVGGELYALNRDAKAAHAEFQAGILTDFAALQAGGSAAAGVRRTVARGPITSVAQAQQQGLGLPGTGGVNRGAILAQNKAYAQGVQALEDYHQAQLLASGSGTKLASTLKGIFSTLSPSVTLISDAGNAVELLNANIDRISPAMDAWSAASGQDTQSILDNLSKVVNDPTSSPDAVAAAYNSAIASMRQANQAWHDSIVSTFGGAGSALDKFANKTGIDISKATGALKDYTAQIKHYDTDFNTIEQRYGKSAQGFLDWAQSQGLAQAGLVHTIATSSRKDVQSFLSNWKTAKAGTDQLATDIQHALGPMFDKIILQLRNVARAFRGLPPIHVDTKQAEAAVANLNQSILDLPNSKVIDIKTHIHPTSPWPDEALKEHLIDPLKRNGAKQIGGVWTVPLDVGVHSSLQGRDPTGVVTSLARAAGWKGNVQNILDTINTPGRDPHYIEVVTQKLADKLGPAAAKAFSSALTKLDTQAGGSDWWKASTWMDAATAHMPDLPSGHTHMFSQRHRPRHEQLRVVLDRRHYDEAQSFQEDYGRGY